MTDPTYAIYLDLDGVMADYDAGIRSLGFKPDPAKKIDLNRSGTDNPFKRSMYEAIRGTDFYRALPFMPGALDLYRAVAPAEPIILTAAPKFGATEDDHHLNPHWLGAAYHKRAWVEERLLPAALPGEGSIWDTWRPGHSRVPLADERFICTTSVRKQQFINRKHSDHQILIDDRRDNCVRWARAGGVAILHTSAEDSIEAVERWQNGRWRDSFQQVPTYAFGFIHGLDDLRTWEEVAHADFRETCERLGAEARARNADVRLN